MKNKRIQKNIRESFNTILFEGMCESNSLDTASRACITTPQVDFIIQMYGWVYSELRK